MAPFMKGGMSCVTWLNSIAYSTNDLAKVLLASFATSSASGIAECTISWWASSSYELTVIHGAFSTGSIAEAPLIPVSRPHLASWDCLQDLTGNGKDMFGNTTFLVGPQDAIYTASYLFHICTSDDSTDFGCTTARSSNIVGTNADISTSMT